MRSGGIRRLYIPGELAFPKGLALFILFFIFISVSVIVLAIVMTPCLFNRQVWRRLRGGRGSRHSRQSSSTSSSFTSQDWSDVLVEVL